MTTKRPCFHAIRTTWLIVACLLAGCGGGGVGDPGIAPPTGSINAPVPAPEPAPDTGSDPTPVGVAAPVLTLTPTAIKAFRFTWNDVAGETEYRLLEDPDGASGFSPVTRDPLPADTTAYEHIAFLPARLNARYILQACKGADCASSAEVRVSGNLVEAVGYVKASNTAMDDWFGYSIALSSDGSTLAVGAIYESSQAQNSGAVYVFTRTAGVWQRQAHIKATDATHLAMFGSGVALSADGNVLAVGASYQGPPERIGAAYVFKRQGGAWDQGIKVLSPAPVASAYFGFSIALSADGHRLAVGALDDLGRRGAVYVFDDGGGIWSSTATLQASNGEAIDQFGWQIALSADGLTLAVGATGEDSAATGIGGNEGNGADSSGAVYVFALTPGGWQQQAYVKASNTTPGDGFGQSVALSADGHTLAVGADRQDSLGSNSGAVYVFARQGIQWAEQSFLKSPHPEVNGTFGVAVALSADGGTLAVGAPNDSPGAIGVGSDPGTANIRDSGSARLFKRAASGWQYQAYVKAPNAETGDFFGGVLALSGDGLTLAVSAVDEDSAATGVGPAASDNNATESGAVYLY